MKILVNTDNNTAGSAELTGKVEAAVEGALGRFGERITRVVVHLSDVSNSTRTHDNDKRCTMEARIARHQPISVSHQGGDLLHVLDVAAQKMAKSLDATLGRLDHTKDRTSIAGRHEL